MRRRPSLQKKVENMTKKTIKVDYLARVEGEGALRLDIKNKKIENVQLKIFEPPRFFEAFLRDRSFTEAPDITSRICGICPVAYQMSAVQAMENALAIDIPEHIRALRRLFFCGEWIESHLLHMVMLHAPDFLGYQDAIQMAKDHGEQVKRGLMLKKLGNQIVSLVGGREVHPVNLRVGGFYALPNKQRFFTLKSALEQAYPEALLLLQWLASFDFPDQQRDYEFVCLSQPDEYPITQGRIVSNKGLDIAVKDFEQVFEEQHVAYTNALHCVIKDRGAYFVGPMARFNLNFHKLPTDLQQLSQQIGLAGQCLNPYKSLLIRGIEVLFALQEAIRIIDSNDIWDEPGIEAIPKCSEGYGATEAPRGILFHHYKIDDEGNILEAKIVPPTSQNQKTIENDLKDFVPQFLQLPDEQLQWHCEQMIRNYDPCISCATHFLNLDIKRR